MASGIFHRSMLPLRHLNDWAPFKLDALGLVTLIGAEDVCNAVGRLVRSRYTDFLPLFGTHLIAGNQFTEASAGVALYNITDEVMSSRLSGWFDRWLSAQKNETQTTVYELYFGSQRGGKLRRMRPSSLLTNSIGLWVMAGLTALTVCMGDYWGLSNAVAMFVSVMVRWYLVHENRRGIYFSPQARNDMPRTDDDDDIEKRILIVLRNGKEVIFVAPWGFIHKCLISTPHILHPGLYRWVSRLGWIVFGVHIITIGQSNLTTQICVIVLLTVSSWLTVQRFGCEESNIGDYVEIKRITTTDMPESQRDGYAFLRLSNDQEDAMIRWNLMPPRTNRLWWDDYGLRAQQRAMLAPTNWHVYEE
jgi:hypothetical protein